MPPGISAFAVMPSAAQRRVASTPKLAAIAAAQEAGQVVGGLRPVDVYAVVIALAGTWSPVSATFTASAADPEADHEHRRAVLRAVVARALVP
jgi:hypothetical protein